MKNIFVTGATGFIGSHLVEELVKEECKIKCLVRPNSNTDFLKKLGVELVFGDLSDREFLKKSLKKINIVYHLAGSVDAKNKDNKIFYETNVLGTKNVLETSIEAGVKRFVHCSSVGVYGWVDKRPNLNENDVCNPATAYEKSKYEAEKYVLSKKDKINITVVRPAAIVYGPRDFSAMYNLFKAIKSKKYFIIGNEKNKIHIVYVKNLVEGIIKASERKKAIGQIYNLADEKQTSIQDLSEEIANSLEVKLSKIKLPKILANGMGLFFEIIFKLIRKEPPLSRKRIRFLTENRTYSIEKAKKDFGYNPLINIKQGMKETVEWYRRNNLL